MLKYKKIHTGGTFMHPEQFQNFASKVISNCGKVIVGKDEVIRQVAVAFLCGGHVLLEDVPGTGKTMLLRAFSKTVGGDFKRIQFTPDLLPSDLTGINFYNPKLGEFEFRPGPLFSGMILADEINRATPRTQSALLEAMEEGQVTVDGITRAMAQPFMVMATQNPIESYGTFPLPEAQMDRFFMRLSMGYMEREQEMAVMARPSTQALVQDLQAVVTLDEIMSLRSQIQQVHVSEDVAGFILDIVQATRKQGVLVGGVSTRGAIALYKAAQVTAAMAGRDYVIPEDVVKEALSVLAHRLTTASGSRADGESFLRDLIATLTVPLEDVKAV
jgi:MoxR-like ATPase